MTVALRTSGPFRLVADGRQVAPEVEASPATAAQGGPAKPAAANGARYDGDRPQRASSLVWSRVLTGAVSSPLGQLGGFSAPTASSDTAKAGIPWPGARRVQHPYRAQADDAVNYFLKLLNETDADGWNNLGESKGAAQCCARFAC